MRKIYGFVVLYLKMLFLEKISLVWSIIFPLIIALVVTRNMSINTEERLLEVISMFWAYIIIISLLNGVGLQLARLREDNLLKTYTLIAGSKIPIVLGTIITQVCFIVVCIIVFNIGISLLSSAHLIAIIWVPILATFLLIPFSMMSILLAIFPIQTKNISTLLNIGVSILFIMSINGSLPFNSYFLAINPMYLVSSICQSLINGEMISIAALSVVIIQLIIGIIAINKLSLVSNIQR